MAIANTATLYQQIHKGSEGGNEFARFVKLLLTAEYKDNGRDFVSESDASGDFNKVDAFISGNGPLEKLNTSFQFKFFPSRLSSKHRRTIEQSLISALKENPVMGRYILITPEDFLKEDQEWFTAMKQKYEKKRIAIVKDYPVSWPKEFKFSLLHWGHTRIVELSLKHEHIGRQYFPSLCQAGIGKFRLASATIDCNDCRWVANKGEKYSYWQGQRDERLNLTTDPVFDFHFTNNSTDIFLLYKIEIHLETIMSEMKGIPTEHFLKSIGTHEYDIDFDQQVNTIEWNDPMIFEVQQPKRFKLLLRNFTNNCPGNTVILKFLFHFNHLCVSTESFHLSF